MVPFKDHPSGVSLAGLLLSGFFLALFAGHSFGASSVYIPRVPSSSFPIGISCQANYPAAGTIYCTNQSPGTLISSTGAGTAGYQNRLMFVAPGNYTWTIPASVMTVKAVVIGAGGNGVIVGGGGGGGGYSEKTITTSGGTGVTVAVKSGNSSGYTSITIGTGTITASTGGGQ